MGFKRPKTVFDLRFAGDFEGLEVRARSVSLREFTAMGELSRLEQLGRRAPTAEDVKDIDALFECFAGALISWNLEEDDGTPVPATLDGIRSQEVDIACRIAVAWIEAVAGVNPDLGKDSSSGETFPVASLPMAPLSPSLAS